MNKELNESIEVVGGYVYLHSVDECGDCVKSLGLITEMSDQEIEYYELFPYFKTKTK
tara:strand:- start:674 stop:844 length:171 start_codon:yes stop_codon:yes gene_type:complete